MATSKKVTELPAITTAANTDIVYIVHDPAGVPVSNKITVQNLLKTVNNVSLAANAYSNAVAKFGTLTINNNVISTTNSSAVIKVSASNTEFVAISNSYVQLQYNVNSSVSESYSNGSNWLYVDSGGVNMETINSTGTITSAIYLTNVAAIMVVNSYSLSLEANGSIKYPDDTYQTTAYTGNKSVLLKDEGTTLSVNSTHEVILCDTNSIGDNLTVYLPNSAANGKVYTIKNINTGSYQVTIQANGAPSIIEVGTSGTFSTAANLASSGNTVSWIYYDGYYRIISSR